MNAIHSVRVVLFWDSEHARDAFGPYFTGAHTHISTHEYHSNVRQHVTVITQIVFDEPLMLYPDIKKDDEDDDDADANYDVLSASDEDNGDNDEEDDTSTSLNHLSSTVVNQW
ncbi:hypothetical protein M9H77_35399 [Catharanthus roseus]|uniref:Uncharacterized protein n=1 Tax=Catharanthus roseus TaxID=4058 RepID=A0ACB9ZQM3_CATRO|nr:hypothetical protein M9H77_35399 [Catharanthus roseus]